MDEKLLETIDNLDIADTIFLYFRLWERIKQVGKSEKNGK